MQQLCIGLLLLFDFSNEFILAKYECRVKRLGENDGMTETLIFN